ncbi:MAG: pyridoxal phosphate-dependent aminotransferase [Candidatus Nanohaloarchaea archaeon]
MIRERVRNIQLSIRKISEKAREQDDIVRFDIGQPSFDTPDHVKDAAREGLEGRQGYTSTVGMDELREVAAEEENLKKGIDVTPEEVMVTAGGMEAVYSTFASVLEKEDTAVFNDPCWGPYKLISEVNGNDWIQVRYFENGSLTEEAREAIEDAKLVVVNTPSNPAGRVLEKAEAKEIAEVADDAGTLLVSDEVYHRLTYDQEHVSPARFHEKPVIIGSTSKNHAMTGWRIGWSVSSPGYIENFAKASRGMTACPPRVSQYAAIEALRNDSHVEEMRREYEKRRDATVKRMNELGWDFVRPEGAIYAFPEVGEDSWDFCMRMIEEGVAMVPGEPFGPESDESVRICFGSTSVKEVEKAFDIIEENL